MFMQRGLYQETFETLLSCILLRGYVKKKISDVGSRVGSGIRAKNKNKQGTGRELCFLFFAGGSLSDEALS
jgi:hypothetical protein